MTDWTDADVELVARALADVHRRAWGDPPDTAGRAILGEFAHAALSALAAAGRDYTAGVADGRRLAAEEIAAACAAEYDRLARTAIRCHRTGDTAEARRVAAQQRVWRAASDLAREHAERTTR